MDWQAAAGARGPWSGSVGPFDRAGLDAQAPLGRLLLRSETPTFEARLVSVQGHRLNIHVGDNRHAVSALRRVDHRIAAGCVDGTTGAGLRNDASIELTINGWRTGLTRYQAAAEAAEEAGPVARAMISGLIVALPVAAGDLVQRGDTVAVIEAMKMESRVLAPVSGHVAAVHCALGDPVASGQKLLVMMPLT